MTNNPNPNPADLSGLTPNYSERDRDRDAEAKPYVLLGHEEGHDYVALRAAGFQSVVLGSWRFSVTTGTGIAGGRVSCSNLDTGERVAGLDGCTFHDGETARALAFELGVLGFIAWYRWPGLDAETAEAPTPWLVLDVERVAWEEAERERRAKVRDNLDKLDAYRRGELGLAIAAAYATKTGDRFGPPGPAATQFCEVCEEREAATERRGIPVCEGCAESYDLDIAPAEAADDEGSPEAVAARRADVAARLDGRDVAAPWTPGIAPGTELATAAWGGDLGAELRARAREVVRLTEEAVVTNPVGADDEGPDFARDLEAAHDAAMLVLDRAAQWLGDTLDRIDRNAANGPWSEGRP